MSIAIKNNCMIFFSKKSWNALLHRFCSIISQKLQSLYDQTQNVRCSQGSLLRSCYVFDKGMELVRNGSVINLACAPSSFLPPPLLLWSPSHRQPSGRRGCPPRSGRTCRCSRRPWCPRGTEGRRGWGRTSPSACCSRTRREGSLAKGACKWRHPAIWS